MLQAVVRALALPFFTALGIELGGPLIGAVPALLANGRPLKTAMELAGDLKIWAVAMAIGGSFTVIEAIEVGLVHRQIHGFVKQGVAVLGALIGAQVGFWLVSTLAKS